jgi:hypothetical protein
MIEKMAVLEKSFAEGLGALNEMRAALGEGELVLSESKAKGKGRAKKSKPEGAEAKERVPSAWNIFLKETVEDMKANGWPGWTGLDGVTYGASERATVKDKSGAEHEAWVYSDGPFKGKEVTPAQGGMTRASFLQAEADPAKKEKALKWQAKLAEKKAASAGSSTAGSDHEEGAEKKPRKPQSEETKAAAALKRAANKAAKATPAAAVGGGSTAAVIPPPPAGKPKMVISRPSAAPTKKAVDLSFYAWEFKGQDYYTNDRSDVVSTEFDWVGRFNGTTIDETVDAPEDLADARMRE